MKMKSRVFGYAWTDFAYLRRSLVCVIAGTLFLALSITSSASAITTGVNWSGKLEQSTKYGEMDIVQHSGATAYRLAIFKDEWNARGSGYYDVIFERAAEKNIRIYPYLVDGGYPAEGEAALGAFGDFGATLVKRYGYSGTFWGGKPYYLPVTAWEVGNEPNLIQENGRYGGKVDPVKYAKFLIYLATRMRTAQTEQSGGGTTILTGGIYLGPIGGGESMTYTDFLNSAYGVAGFSKSFDGLAIHPYGFDYAHAENKTISEVTNEITGVRNLLNGKPNGSSRSLWVTEIGWPISGSGQPSVKNEGEQERLLNESFNWIKGQASAKNIQSLFWFNLRDDPAGGTWAHRTGLMRGDRSPRPAWSAFQAQNGAAAWTPPPQTPIVEVGSASGVGSYRATLNGTVNPNGLEASYHFDYGPTTGYGSSVPVPNGSAGSGESAISVSATIDGLQPGTTYHYRLSASNSEGTINSGDQQFTTQQATPASVVDSTGATHLFYHGSSGQLEEYYQYGSLWKHRIWGTANQMAGDPAAIFSEGKIWVYYRTPSGQLRNWWFKGGEWGTQEWGVANAMAGDPTAVEGTDGRRRVLYRAPNGQLQGWWFKGGEWNLQELGVPNVVAGDPAAVASEGKAWVYYRAPNGQLQGWWLKGAEWGFQEWGVPNAMAGDPTAVEGTDGRRRVLYRAPNGQLQGWWFKGGEWNFQELGVANAVAGDPAAVASEGKAWVYYRTPSGQLRAWWLKGAAEWGTQEWGVTNAMGGDPTAIANPTGKREVFYFSPSGSPNRWWFLGSEWQLETIATPSPSFIPRATATVDAGGITHVYYRGQNGGLREWYQEGSLWKHRVWGTANQMAGDPAAILSEGKIWVYYRTPSGQLKAWWFKGAEWGGPQELGTINAMAGDPTAVEGADGRRRVFYRTPNGQLQGWWFKGAELAFQEYGTINAVAGDPAAVSSEGKAWVYYRTPSGQLRSWWLKNAELGSQELGTINAMAGDPTAVEATDGRRRVLYRAPNGQLRGWWFKGAELGFQELGVANAVAGDPTAVSSEGKAWIYHRTPSGQLRSWWLKNAEWGTQEWGVTGAMGGDPIAIATPAGKREVFYFDPEAFPFRWGFSGAEWSFDPLIY
jgi:hypothetical protein